MNEPDRRGRPEHGAPGAVLDALIDELERTAERLRAGEVEPADASAMVEALAQKAAEIGAALEREARAPAPGEPPGQETLL
jgi:hypothetical protein